MVTRTKFAEQLERLNDELIKMSKAVEFAIYDTTKALVGKDVELAKKIIASDDDIDAMEKEIERICLEIILRQQPVAGDLRWVSSVLKIITDLERIGDHATDISEMTTFLAKQEYVSDVSLISKMADETMKMLNKSINAFIKKDVQLAEEVIAADDIVDDLFLQKKNELIESMKKDANNANQAMDFMMIAKYYERVGDHATNIAEWTLFAATGVHKDTK